MWKHFQTKQELIDYLLENEHCFDAYWTQRDYLSFKGNEFHCQRCGNVIGQFNYDMVWWEALI